MSTKRPWLSIAETSTHLGVTQKTVRRYISDGMLTGYRMGQHLIRLDPDEVDALLRPMPNAKSA